MEPGKREKAGAQELMTAAADELMDAAQEILTAAAQELGSITKECDSGSSGTWDSSISCTGEHFS